MKATHILMLTAAAISFVFSVPTDTKNNTDHCPDGSKLDVASGRCVQVCVSGDPGTTTTNKCQINPADVYVHDVELPDSPVGHLELPACKNITLQQGEFTISDDGSTLKANVIIRVPAVIKKFRLSEGNTTADVCYPLSPQLLQCPLRKLNGPNYTPQLQRTLLNRWTNETIGFRDYYTSPESVDIFACIGTVNEKRMLRCNYIKYTPDEYRFTDGGRRLLLLATNTSIYQPEYTDIGEGTLNVCYPFSLAFTRCTVWMLELREFRLQSDHTLLDIAHGDILKDMGDYFIQRDGKAVVCFITPESLKATLALYFIYAIVYLVSAVCLCVAFVIHLLVPSLNYHAKPLLCHMICMTVMYTALAIRRFMKNIDPAPCYTLFVATYYSAMASFFWLNVLSFDLWTIFANLQTTSSWLSCSCRCNVNRRFYYYSAYALGVPLLFCIGAIVVDNNPELQDALHLHPGIPDMCWFNEKRSANVFLYIPMITVLVVNLALFVSTVFNLRQASRGVEVVNKKLNTQLLIVCFKLFIIMGFCWIGEAIAWTSDANIAAYYVPDAINSAQGIIIFLIYICKKATYRLLRNKFCPKKDSDGKWTMDLNTSRGNSRKTSSSGLSMCDRDNSTRSSSRPEASNRDISVRTDSSSMRNASARSSDRTHKDSTNSQLPTTNV